MTPNDPAFCQQLLVFIDRIEKLNDEAGNIKSDIKSVYDEAKSAGFDTKYIRKMIALRKLEPDELDESDSLTEMYRHAIGL